MMLIATRGDIEAWADDPFDPATDEVEIRVPDQTPQRVLWQSALKWGYWDEP